MSKKISLKQFLMKTGRFEKVYACVNSIIAGNVVIGSKAITNPNYFFNPDKEVVKLNNEKIKSIKNLYFILNKPAVYLSQKSGNEKTVYDLLKKLSLTDETVNSLFAVGRLDKGTEGLMLITNDGKLSSLISNPKNEVKKEYYVKLESPIIYDEIKKIEAGVAISIDGADYRTKPAKIKIIGEKELCITISEGKKRQIRKMVEAADNRVAYLKRVSIGNLQLGSLKSGQMKQLSREEIYTSLGFQ